MKLFVHTWGWLTLRDRRETHHRQAQALYFRIRDAKGEIFTTDYVLDETFTLLFRRLPFPLARESLEKIEETIEGGSL